MDRAAMQASDCELLDPLRPALRHALDDADGAGFVGDVVVARVLLQRIRVAEPAVIESMKREGDGGYDVNVEDRG